MPESSQPHDETDSLLALWMARVKLLYEGAIARASDADSLRSDGFRLVSSRMNQQRLFKRRKSTTCHELLSVGNLKGTSMDDIVYALHADTTASHRSSLALRYRDRLLDGCVLHTMQSAPSSSSDAFHWSGVKYVKFKLDASELFEPRDATYFEYSRTTQNHLGQRVLFLARETHAFADMPVVPEVVRMEFQEWFLFTLVDNTIEYAHFNSGNPMGSYAASFVFNKHAVQFHSDATLRLGHTSRQRYLLEHQVAMTINVDDAFSFKTCVCTAPLKSGGRPRCHGCTHRMCSNCEVRIPSAQPMLDKRRVIHVKFCKHCLVMATTQPKLPSRPENVATPWSESSSTCSRLDFDSARSGKTAPCDIDDDVDTNVSAPNWQVGSQDTLWMDAIDETTHQEQGMCSARSLEASLEVQQHLLDCLQRELSRRDASNSAKCREP